MRRLLLHPHLCTLGRLTLGAVFLVAAWPKLLDPPAFAKAVDAYRLLPAWAVNPLALVLPLLEALLGVALLLGVLRRAAATWAAALLLVFTAALGVNLARRHPVDCGCFRVDAPPRNAEERLRDMRLTLLRDLALLLLAAQALAAPRPKGAR